MFIYRTECRLFPHTHNKKKNPYKAVYFIVYSYEGRSTADTGNADVVTLIKVYDRRCGLLDLPSGKICAKLAP